MRYRADVDGLRAVAIIPVVLYHFGVPGFSGGFIGVDVFFVISGFLITTLIHNELGENRFSLVRFYERRIRRILPALFVVLFAVAILSYSALFPMAFGKFGESVTATSVFASNIEFWRESGYFDAAADQKPLLHTWSLAVEEQFYLFFPPLMMAIAHYAKRRYVAILAAGFALSLALSIWAVSAKPDAAFYLLPPRAWELAVGALIAAGAIRYDPGASGGHALAALGLLMIGCAVVFYTASTPFPGAAALLPCLGAGLIIYTGQYRLYAVNRLLASPPFVSIGKISYSLYLWHWPIYVLGKYHLGRELLPLESAGLIAVSVAMAALSWRYVEQPFRKPGGVVSRPVLFAQAGAAISVFAGLGAAIYLGDGFPSRFSPGVQSLLAAEEETLPCKGSVDVSFATACRIGKSTAPPSFILWGDSHARAMFPALVEAADRMGEAGLAFTGDGCPPLLGANRTDAAGRYCRAHNDMVRQFLEDHDIDTVILAARWAADAEGTPYGHEEGTVLYRQDDQSKELSREENRRVFVRSFRRTIEYLHDSGHRIVLVGPVPEIGWQVPETLARRRMRGLPEDIGPTMDAFEARNGLVLSEFARQKDIAETVYPHRALCQAAHCAVERQGKALYIDEDHLSRAGAGMVSAMFDPILAGDP